MNGLPETIVQNQMVASKSIPSIIGAMLRRCASEAIDIALISEIKTAEPFQIAARKNSVTGLGSQGGLFSAKVPQTGLTQTLRHYPMPM